MRHITYLLLFVLPGFSGFAQLFLNGKVRKKESQEVLSSVNIFNQTQRKHKLSDDRCPASDDHWWTELEAGNLDREKQIEWP